MNKIKFTDLRNALSQDKDFSYIETTTQYVWAYDPSDDADIDNELINEIK